MTARPITVILWFLLSPLCVPVAPAAEPRPDLSRVPGVVIDHIPAASRQYVGSPSIAVLPEVGYVASHDVFGPGSERNLTRIFSSKDRGRSWRHTADVVGQWWSTLFVHKGALYLMGTSREYGYAVIRRSSDGGSTWTEPTDRRSGLLLADGKYHCAPVPVVMHGGRIWRAMEDAMGPGGWGRHFRSFLMSAPVEADLLDAVSWTSSTRLARDPEWLDGRFGGWLEGNAVVTPEGRVVNILRVDVPRGGQKAVGEKAVLGKAALEKGVEEKGTMEKGTAETGQAGDVAVEKAAIVEISSDGKTASFDPAKGFVDFPGGAKKFTIRREPAAGLYWSLTNFIPERHLVGEPARTRNTLALISSPDLRAWTVRSVVLYHPDPERHGFQYVDWLFEGDDIIAVSRTAYDDGLGGAHNQHDANFLTFHRVQSFRTRTLSDAPAEYSAPKGEGPERSKGEGPERSKGEGSTGR